MAVNAAEESQGLRASWAQSQASVLLAEVLSVAPLLCVHSGDDASCCPLQGARGRWPGPAGLSTLREGQVSLFNLRKEYW